MAVSVRDVAQRANVSVGTVSNVLNRPDSVRKSTRDRVERAIQDLQFVPNDAARQLRAGQSTSIAFIVLDAGNPFFTDVARGVEEQAAQSGHTVLLANSDNSQERERAHLAQFERQRVAGVLLVPTFQSPERLEHLRSRGVPVVFVDRDGTDAGVPSVAVDDVVGGQLAARHLLEQGRRNLVFIGGPDHLTQVRDRRTGALKALEGTADVSFTEIPTQALTLDEGIAAGSAVRELIAGGRCDGVFAANDLLAIGLQQTLLSGPNPVAIPSDVALIGYDDIIFASAAVVPITSVRQPRHLIGKTAVELLFEEQKRIGTRDPGHKPRHVMYRPELAIRASSAAT